MTQPMDQDLGEQEVVESPEAPEADEQDDDTPEGADQLGDAGKKALDAMKAKRNEYRDKYKKSQEELGQLRNAAKNDQPTADDIRREAEQTAASKANARIVRSEIRAAAAGKLADPKDALTFMSADQFEVDENGEVDGEEIADAIDELLQRKPYLAAATAKRFQGTGDGGAARKAGKPKQLSRDEVKRMSSDEIAKAQEEGRLNDLLAGKTKG